MANCLSGYGDERTLILEGRREILKKYTDIYSVGQKLSQFSKLLLPAPNLASPWTSFLNPYLS